MRPSPELVRSGSPLNRPVWGFVTPTQISCAQVSTGTVTKFGPTIVDGIGPTGARIQTPLMYAVMGFAFPGFQDQHH